MNITRIVRKYGNLIGFGEHSYFQILLKFSIATFALLDKLKYGGNGIVTSAIRASPLLFTPFITCFFCAFRFLKILLCQKLHLSSTWVT